ncbi:MULTISPECIES: L-rhamnose mutarotase [Halanaerobium]|jgi:L-rhamnose mutarotase|uniref:L-rhamnose mutarotase n=1 Tax=Halanaerobium congolense TaxID=54121 RepID=A0A1G6KI50_9FIRM|nr:MULTISPECIES: L-rhamnose mutarotase [Halanaerobium]PUU91698.1 MAG: L-rhamnose mutarotase [Halanaerobium sp.]PXV62553.1 L-rhamnose mutarotase [Halanaerobium congolense]SDC30607.1 L-rhamnose mutarotase [Halanaerobium congolense]
MQRVGFKLFLKDDAAVEEYKKRHDEIWPEMLELLDKAGIKNYSIWNSGRELFAYYECENVEKADRVQSESEIVAKWNLHMEDLLVSEEDEAGNLVPVKESMELMFYKR